MPTDTKAPTEGAHLTNFIRQHIEKDLAERKYSQRHWGGGPGPTSAHAKAPLDPAKIRTRFPPEPNGYLHIGHAKSICLNFGLADEFGGKTNLRFDDTNPEKEEQEYVDSITKDVHWLGFEWDGLRYASDYFDQLYEWAIKLINDGKAYVDDLSAEEIRQYRGTLTEDRKR